MTKKLLSAIHPFLDLIKPGIIFGNSLTLLGGFFLASATHPFSFSLLFFILVAMACIIASGCVFNNFFDQDIDRHMLRTQNRVLVNGSVSEKLALIYGTCLGLIGFFLLQIFSNALSVFIAALGLFFYTFIYTVFLKRRSVYGTLVGGIAGAVPPVIGYCAVTGVFDFPAFLLFCILFAWQIPHFYAIAIYRLKDFQAVNIPVLPAKQSLLYTQCSMLSYLFLFMISTLLLAFFYTNFYYQILSLFFNITWLSLAIFGFFTEKKETWAKLMFFYSLIVITFFSLGLLLVFCS